jgi:hypothetical protein
MAAYDTGKMILFVRSVMWDLKIPPEAATVMYEDNDACTAMGNAQKPTTRTRHMDIKYFSICEWVDRDLMHLERIDTKLTHEGSYTRAISQTRRLPSRTHPTYLLTRLPIHYRDLHG